MNHASVVTWRISGLQLNLAAPLRSQRSLKELLRCSTTLQPACSNFSIRRAHHVWATSSIFTPFKSTLPVRSCHECKVTTWKQAFATKSPKGKRATQATREPSKPEHVAREEGKVGRGDLGTLGESEIKNIFGENMGMQRGNVLLALVQSRRQEGTLDLAFGDPDINHELVGLALSFLRREHPMDEDRAVMRRIEREEEESYKPQGSASTRYSESVFEKKRKENEAKWEAEQATAIEEAARNETGSGRSGKSGKPGTLVQNARSTATLSKQEKSEFLKKWEKRAKLSDYTEPPVMTKTQRLLPTAIFVVLSIAASLSFAMNYKPPERAARIFPDTPPAAATILTIISLNVFGFMMWKTPPMWRFMNKFGLLIVATPRAVSAIGNVFSHQRAAHLATNMFVLWFIGTRLHDEVGRGNFMAIYVSSGVLASMISLTRSVFTGALTNMSLGASGSIAGVVAAYLMLHATDRLRFIFWPGEDAPSIRGYWLLAIIVFMELVSLRSGKNVTVDNVSHLGGMLGGVAAAELIKYRRKARNQREKLIDTLSGSRVR